MIGFNSLPKAYLKQTSCTGSSDCAKLSWEQFRDNT